MGWWWGWDGGVTMVKGWRCSDEGSGEIKQ